MVSAQQFIEGINKITNGHKLNNTSSSHKRAGGTKHDVKVDGSQCFFHESQAQALINVLRSHWQRFGGDVHERYNGTIKVLDACAHDGVLGRAIKGDDSHYKVDYVDIRDYSSLYNDNDKENFIQANILNYKPENGYDLIICNPEFHPVNRKREKEDETFEYTTEEIYNHLKSLLNKDQGLLFFIIDNTFFYQEKERALLAEIQKYHLLPTNTFKHCGCKRLDIGVGVHYANICNITAAAMIENVYIPLPIIHTHKDQIEIDFQE